MINDYVTVENYTWVNGGQRKVNQINFQLKLLEINDVLIDDN